MMPGMNSTFGSLALAVLLAAAGAQAVAQEPPAVATKPAAAPQKAVPPAAPSAAAPAVAPAAPSAQIPSDKVRLSPAEIAAKEKTLDEKIARYRSRTTEGEAITGKWGALSELYKKYGTEAAGVELSCDVVKDRFKRAKESGLSDFMIKELSSDVKAVSYTHLTLPTKRIV